tara:strand:- start:7 stop:819 length:813 start_codon:yes stop_codon:yes gene_type:complete
MNKDLSQIEFYFPSGEFKDKNEIVDSILSLIKEKGSIDYSGYADVDLLKRGLFDHIGNGSAKQYKEISEEQKLEIEKTISETIEKCNEKLSVPTKNFIFVHPYLTTEDDKVFDGVMAVAVYSCVFHLFVNLDQYSKKSIENTVAHELNHTIYYYHHYDDFNNYTLLDEILLEGLAENFREQYFDPEVSKWAGALTKDEAFNVLKESKDILESRDQKVIKEFLFGNDKYQRWTGYSVGYWLVKEFIKNNSDLSWDEIMKVDPQKFLEVVEK